MRPKVKDLVVSLPKMKEMCVAFQNYIFNQKVYYVVEDVEWAVKYVGKEVSNNLNKIGIKTKITLSHIGIFNSLIHFGSINVFMPGRDRINVPHRSNKVVVTYFHVLSQDKRLKLLQNASNFVSLWHTTNSITKENLISYGIPREKIVVIPLGIDLDTFKPLSNYERINMRTELGIPNKHIVIGSFQKDGIGWGQGLEPKPEKGPEIFCAVVKKLNKVYPIFVLLTGPSRGFVKSRLKEAGIPYKHYPFVDYSLIPAFYSCLDLYLVTSRIEGGPRALLECMSTRTPFVTTRVGMVPDVISEGEDGLSCDIDDISGIVNKAQMLIDNQELREAMRVNMENTAQNYSWSKVITRYRDEIYMKLAA